MVTVIEIASLHQPTQANQSHALDEACIECYMADLDAADPVLVYEHDGVRVLVNGRHRVAAAERLGLTTISADVQPGTAIDATRYRDLHGQPD